MSVIRNFIEVVGLADEGDLPDKSFGQLIKYNETEQLKIPRDKPGIKEIYQVGLKIEIKSKRVIHTADTKTVVIDGIKHIKIVCTQHENTDKVIMINLQLPYNTFFEVPCHINSFEDIQIHILDAYFQVLEKRRIYSHFLYLIDIRYKAMELSTKLLNLESDDRESETQIALSHEEFYIGDTEKYDSINDELACEYL